MAEDLGPWPPAQATVLLEVLKKAGLDPDAKRTREGIQVTVPDEQADDAHRILVANMDEIAQAARTPSKGRTARQSDGRSRAQRTTSASSESSLPTERLTRLARPLGLLIILLLVVGLAGPLRLPLLVVGVGALIYLIGKQAQRENGDR